MLPNHAMFITTTMCNTYKTIHLDLTTELIGIFID